MNAESCSDLYQAVGEDFWVATWCNSTAVEGYLFSCHVIVISVCEFNDIVTLLIVVLTRSFIVNLLFQEES